MKTFIFVERQRETDLLSSDSHMPIMLEPGLGTLLGPLHSCAGTHILGLLSAASQAAGCLLWGASLPRRVPTSTLRCADLVSGVSVWGKLLQDAFDDSS